jgi:hypothetical protein
MVPGAFFVCPASIMTTGFATEEAAGDTSTNDKEQGKIQTKLNILFTLFLPIDHARHESILFPTLLHNDIFTAIPCLTLAETAFVMTEISQQQRDKSDFSYDSPFCPFFIPDETYR